MAQLRSKAKTSLDRSPDRRNDSSRRRQEPKGISRDLLEMKGNFFLTELSQPKLQLMG